MKASTPRFPRLIHVTKEWEDDHSNSWFQVHVGGVFDIEEDDTSVAVYQLVKVGKVNITKSFMEKKGK